MITAAFQHVHKQFLWFINTGNYAIRNPLTRFHVRHSFERKWNPQYSRFQFRSNSPYSVLRIPYPVLLIPYHGVQSIVLAGNTMFNKVTWLAKGVLLKVGTRKWVDEKRKWRNKKRKWGNEIVHPSQKLAHCIYIDFFSREIMAALIHCKSFTTWLRLEICTTCNA